MALPAVVGLLGKIAAIPGVKEGAAKVAVDVYGRLMKRRADPALPKPSATAPADPTQAVLASLGQRVDDLATRDELIAAFAALQAELDRRHQRTFALLGVVILLQAVLLATVLLR